MRGHEHSEEHGGELRPRADRLVSDEGSSFEAAAAGRPDLLGAAGMLDLQRAAGNASVSGLVEEERSPVHDVVNSGGGAPLDSATRADMETRLGHDFSDVRVHTGSDAHESAKSVQAHAYTVGPNIVFQRDRYDPSSTAGRTMLAHELTHVVQQRSGPVDGTPAAGGIRVSDPYDRFEREATATAHLAVSIIKPPALPSTGSALQRTEASAQETRDAPGEDELQNDDTTAEG